MSIEYAIGTDVGKNNVTAAIYPRVAMDTFG